MEQYPSDNFIPQREPNEVTLEYVAEPKPYVAYYVQDRPLPGRKPETAAQEPPAKTRRKGHRGLKFSSSAWPRSSFSPAGCTPPGGSACCRTASTAAITATTMAIPTTIITTVSLTRAPSRSCRSYRRTTAYALSTRTATATR